MQLPLLSRLILGFARLEPSGLAPFAPGTWGSLFALFIALFFFLPQTLWLRILSLIVLFAVGVWASTIAEAILAKKDPSEIVIDELVGQWIVLLPLSLELSSKNFYIQLLIAFALFRFFDILKPYPITKLEDTFSTGFGIMIDDVLAGIYALICFVIIRHFFFI